ncbi:MAG: isochorismatase family protein [Ktedonobacteraceae bacterium]
MAQPDGKRTALLLMDLQQGIVENYSDPGFLTRIQRALAAARRTKLPVIWVKVCFRNGYPEV